MMDSTNLTPYDLMNAPELAVLAVLDAAADAAVIALMAANPETFDDQIPDDAPLPPPTSIAKAIISLAQTLKNLTATYRRSNAYLPPSPPVQPPHANSDF